MNNCQSEAAYADVNTPLLIIAGAGSGKTMTMVRRVQHILKATKCQPSDILAITFTRNSSKEMKERLVKICGNTAAGVVVSTIHAICLRILRDHLSDCPHFGFTSKFSFISKREQLLMIEEGLDEYDKGLRKEVQQDPKARQFRIKRTFSTVMKHRASPSSLTSELQFVIGHYEKSLKESDALDFSGLIQLTTQLLNEPVVGDRIRQKYTFMLLDEFQDVSLSQFNLVKALLGNRGSITAVGDDDQSIYGFQGANIGNFTQFEQYFRDRGGLNMIRLEQNYRSSGNIVMASNSVIAVNRMRQQKKLWTDKEGGDKIVVCECRNTQCEAAFLISELQRRHSQGQEWRSMAVLFRTNATGSEFQSCLRKASIPFSVQGEHLYSPMEIDDVLSLLRITVRDDNRAMLAIAKFTKSPIPQEIFVMMRDYATSNNVSWLHAARYLLTQPASKFKKLKTSTSSGGGGGQQATKRKNPLTQLKKLVDLVDTLRLRVEELPLPSFMKRVIDFHPWVKQRMQKDTSSSTSTASASSSSSSEQPHHYGNLGNALIQEAEIFAAANPSLKGKVGLCNAEEMIAERIEKVCRFLDHLATCSENDEPLQLQSSSSSSLTAAPSHFKVNKASSSSSSTLQEKQEKDREGRDAVFLGTVHQSKGLEWDTVFVVRFNENEFPLASYQQAEEPTDNNISAAIKNREQIFDEEERRLAYVALSRGRHNLSISFIVQDQNSNGISVPPSRFLSDVPRSIQTRVECFSPTDPPSLDTLSTTSAATSSSSTSSNNLINIPPSTSTTIATTSSWSSFLQNPTKPSKPQSTNHSTLKSLISPNQSLSSNNNQQSNYQTNNNQPSNYRTNNHQPNNYRTNNHQPNNYRTNNHQPSNYQKGGTKRPYDSRAPMNQFSTSNIKKPSNTLPLPSYSSQQPLNTHQMPSSSSSFPSSSSSSFAPNSTTNTDNRSPQPFPEYFTDD